METSSEWLQKETIKCLMIDAEKIPVILDQPEHLVAIYLSMADGFRALISNCLAEDGLLNVNVE